jgi:PhzF family phenazine biosynthesis protein
MNQGTPEFLWTVDDKLKYDFLRYLNLTPNNIYPDLPMEVVSTGLPYLIVPIASGLEHAKISVNNFEEQLRKINAKFVYVFDVNKMEGRTWDNFGAVEDVATGSAAGPTGAYLNKWNICKENIIINQGSFVGRPSKLKVFVNQSTGEIKVSGNVNIIAKGNLLL